MIHELRLDWDTPETYASLDFPAGLLTIVNPTPYPVWGRSGALGPPLTGGGQTYIVPAGTTMSLPIKQRDWGFKLLTSGVKPASLAPVLIFFTQDETAPSVLSIGVATVSYDFIAWGKEIDLGADLLVQGGTWLALDDTQCFLDIQAPSGRAVFFVNSNIKIGAAGTLRRVQWGIYDDLDATVYEFCDLAERALNDTYAGTFSGVVDFAAPGARRVYLRARESAASGPGFSVSRFLNMGALRG